MKPAGGPANNAKTNQYLIFMLQVRPWDNWMSLTLWFITECLIFVYSFHLENVSSLLFSAVCNISPAVISTKVPLAAI